MSPVQALIAGHANHVTLIPDVGQNEFNGGVYTNTFRSQSWSPTPAQYRRLVAEQFRRLAPTVERLHPLSRFNSPYTAYLTIMADSAAVLVHFNPSLLDADQRALQLQLLREWTHLAWTGRPTAPPTPLWERYSTPGNPVMTLAPGDASATVPTSFDAYEHNCGFWDRVTRY